MEPVGQRAADFVASPIGQGLLHDPSLWFRLTSDEGQYLYVSPQVTGFLGYEAADFKHLSGRDIIHPDEYEAAASALAALADGPLSAVYRMRHKNGEYVWVSSHLEKLGPMTLTLGRCVATPVQSIAWHRVDSFL